MRSLVTGIEYKRNPIPKDIRQDVFDQAGGKCTYCKLDFTAVPKAFTVDHIEHKYTGGTDERQNLIAACRKCNAARGARTFLGHKRYINKRLKEKGAWLYSGKFYAGGGQGTLSPELITKIKP